MVQAPPVPEVGLGGRVGCHSVLLASSFSEELSLTEAT